MRSGGSSWNPTCPRLVLPHRIASQPSPPQPTQACAPRNPIPPTITPHNFPDSRNDRDSVKEGPPTMRSTRLSSRLLSSQRSQCDSASRFRFQIATRPVDVRPSRKPSIDGRPLNECMSLNQRITKFEQLDLTAGLLTRRLPSQRRQARRQAVGARGWAKGSAAGSAAVSSSEESATPARKWAKGPAESDGAVATTDGGVAGTSPGGDDAGACACGPLPSR